ncbi:hypothetical protein EG68_03208 [Paragonimus skrjabini miyazakii]|uniref:EF-hand domain-containing protein n=1 Tax=Paragonimus skrjabini miyazakii TaxID=59628 RepID=A0A8S9YFB7_9TREM|nr:hypothetical protein EG68_03208 [Paragonimus skrjabini miyazakii]
MDPFLSIYFEIDKDDSGVITVDELDDYVRTHDLDPGMVEQWETLFDPENTGEITLDKFCEVLGLQPSKVREEHAEETHAEPPASIDTDLLILYEDIDEQDKTNILNHVRSLVREQAKDDRSKVAAELKRYLDKTYGRCWQVLVTDGSLWANITCVSKYSLHVRLGTCCYLLWMTSE